MPCDRAVSRQESSKQVELGRVALELREARGERHCVVVLVVRGQPSVQLLSAVVETARTGAAVRCARVVGSSIACAREL